MTFPLATVENLRSLAELRGALKNAKPDEKIAVFEKYLAEIVERITPEMTTKKLTTAIATDMVDRIEKLQRQINNIYAEADSYDGAGNSNVIRDAVKARDAMRESEFEAAGLLESFDAEDEAA